MPLRNAGGNALAVGAYQQDAVQTGITEIYSRHISGGENNNVGPLHVSGSLTSGPVSTVTASAMSISGTSAENTTRWQVMQRNASETRPSNGVILFGLYLGRAA